MLYHTASDKNWVGLIDEAIYLFSKLGAKLLACNFENKQSPTRLPHTPCRYEYPMDYMPLGICDHEVLMFTSIWKHVLMNHLTD